MWRSINRSISLRLPLAVLVLGLAAAPAAWAHGDDEETSPLHFSHPLITESPSPDTKVRLDYFFQNRAGEDNGTENTVRLEGEYAFSPSLSLEVDVPYSFVNPDDAPGHHRLDSVELALKYANFHFAEKHLLLGGGVEFELPTGNEEVGIGSDHTLEVAPYLDFGYAHDHLEVVGFVHFGVPVNESGEDESDLELGWNLSFLYHVTDRLSAILEFDGEHIFGGEEDGFAPAYITPGVKFQPFDDWRFKVGAGVRMPLTHDREFHAMPVVSLFYHF